LFNKERLTLIALTLVALLLAGCGLFGPKSFDIVVRIEPPVEGVKIFVDGVHRATTEADGQVELNVKANAKLTAELEGYTFKQKEIKVTEAGEYVFEIETSPGRKGAIVSVKTVLEDIQVWAGETPFEDLDLPSKVEVVLDDDEEVEVAVDWTAAEEDYDYETAGVYELEGVLVPGEGITNPDNITVEVKVVVEDKEPYDDAKYYLAGFFADYEEIGPDVDKLTLPTEIDLGDGVTAKVTWESSNPEVLDVDGNINHTAEDVEVTLTGTITIEQAGPEGQAEEDPTVFTITVTVLADPELKAKALVEELEAIDGPKHYSEVDAIEELLREAKDAVSIIQDPITRVKLQADVLAEETRITGILDRYVKAVKDALESDLELLEALGTFWDIDEKLIATYQSLMIAANTKGELETVHDIQKIIEKAPEEAAKGEEAKKKAEAAEKIIEAARGNSLIDFRNALIQYGEYLERVNLEHDENYTILKKYKEAIAGLADDETQDEDPEDIQAAIDDDETQDEDPVGIEDIQAAIDEVNREQAEEAVKEAVKSLKRSDWTRANTLVAYMADDEAEADDQPKKDAQDALAKLDLVLELVEAAQNGELGDLYGALEELEVKDVAVDLLIEYQEAVKNALKDGAVPALKGQEDVADVIGVLQALVNDKNNELDKFGVTVTQAKVGEDKGLKFTIVAYNKVGKVKTTDITTPSAIKVSIGEEEFTYAPSPWDGGKIKVDLSSRVTFDTIGEQSGLLTLTIGGEEYKVYFEFVVTADPVDGIVTTDAKEYTAGEMIKITVELLYEKLQESAEPKYLDTLNGEYPAKIFIGGTDDPDGPRYYSKLLTFTNGVAVAEVRAEKAGNGQQVEVRVEFEDEVVMTAKEPVKIQAGDAVKLGVTGVTGDEKGALLVAQDDYGNRVLTYEGPRTIKVTYEPKGTGVTASYLIDPDGQVVVKFSEGEARVLYGEFEFAPDLEAGKTYTFTFTVVEDGLTGTTDYTHPVPDSGSGETGGSESSEES